MLVHMNTDYVDANPGSTVLILLEFGYVLGLILLEQSDTVFIWFSMSNNFVLNNTVLEKYELYLFYYILYIF